MADTKTLNKGNVVSAYLREVREEVRMVTWPTRPEITRLTVMVLAVCVIVGAYLGVLDYLFTLLMGYII